MDLNTVKAFEVKESMAQGRASRITFLDSLKVFSDEVLGGLAVLGRTKGESGEQEAVPSLCGSGI